MEEHLPSQQLAELKNHDDIPEEQLENASPLSPNEESAFSPPARIAARFCRSSPAVRRKSSAASSRRNSLSSIHSMQSIQSDNSYRAACRSNHVAQYLRRASILEGRKARLAAREAHAEQVRIRAALARTAPRGSNSEERSIAAQQARDERLANVAATCAEEVRRAKRVAEETRERKAAEEERYRTEMENRMADAEKRRIEYKRNIRKPRTTSSPPAVEIKKSTIKEASLQEKEVAAKCIQQTWKSQRRRKIFDQFSQLGLSIDKVHAASFEDVRALMCDGHVLDVTTKVLTLLKIYPSTEKSLDTHPTTRTFLTAYLLLGHPTQVMSQAGEQEQVLIQKSKELVISFESALAKASVRNRYVVPPEQLQALHLTHSAYATTFNDWKTKDKTILIELLVQDFVNLDAIWQTVKDDTDGSVADDYHRAIRENQMGLLVRLKKLTGPDRMHQIVRKAIRDSRRQNFRRKPVGDVRPRAAANIQTGSSKIHPDTSNGEGSSGLVESAQITAPLPPSDAEQTRSIARLFSIMPSNRIVTHELVIDKDFRIDTTPHTKMRDEVSRSICDSMRKAFEQGKGDEWTVAAAANVRAKLLHLLASPKGAGSLYHLISETLDPELIQRQCTQGSFSYQNFFDFVATILPKLCAPVRDAQVQALSEDLRQFGNLDEMIEKLFKILQTIDLLALDYSNYLLSNVAARLVKEAPGYEQRMFAKDLSEGRITLERTRRWWNNASINVLTEADRLDPSYRPTLQKTYARGLVDLSIAQSTLRDQDLPETLELDKARLVRTREQSVRVAVIGTILLGAKNLLKRDVRSQWKQEATRIWEVLTKHGYLEETLPNRLVSIIESSHPLPPATKSQLCNTISRILAQAGAGKFTDPVAKVLFSRLRQHVFQRISASSSNERARAVGTASESLSTAGLPEFGAIVGSIVDLLARVSDADCRAHGIWYEKIAGESGAGNQDDVEGC